ncbi:MAG: hypothetical protein DRI86_12765 [Bacteroidetes bacterium]|nr:MAG: hypothetical protein DRI86_12765 [Bacteroidota bacterium]
MEINLLNGISNIEFGISKYEFSKKIDSDSKFEIIEEDGDFKTEAIYIDNLESSLFFEGSESEMKFAACDTQNHNSILFGKQIFKLNKDELINLMKDNNYSNLEEEVEEWGEKRLGYFDARIDFYFDNNKLKSVSWGVE